VTSVSCILAMSFKHVSSVLLGNGYIEWHEFLKLMKGRMKDPQKQTADMRQAFAGRYDRGYETGIRW